MDIKPYKQAFEEWRTQYFTRVLIACGNNVTQAARVAGKNRTHFYHVMKKAKVKREANKPGRKPTNQGNQAWQEMGA